jgi:hypothetical protein
MRRGDRTRAEGHGRCSCAPIEQLLTHRSGIGDYLDEEAGFDVGDTSC